MGYWGDVNINIASWRWPNHLGLPIWNAYHASNMCQVAPIIFPAYPAMNSTLSDIQQIYGRICQKEEEKE
eukprot:3035214-Ditylum_brightwellii.AAC.1